MVKEQEQRLPAIAFHTKEKSQKKRALRQKRSLPFISLTLPVLLIAV